MWSTISSLLWGSGDDSAPRDLVECRGSLTRDGVSLYDLYCVRAEIEFFSFFFFVRHEMRNACAKNVSRLAPLDSSERALLTVARIGAGATELRIDSIADDQVWHIPLDAERTPTMQGEQASGPFLFVFYM